jgi:hypothetical protein
MKLEVLIAQILLAVKEMKYYSHLVLGASWNQLCRSSYELEDESTINRTTYKIYVVGTMRT